MSRVFGVVMVMAAALLGIYLYNRFSGKNVAQLGAPAAAGSTAG